MTLAGVFIVFVAINNIAELHLPHLYQITPAAT
jgi:hypothetical protein